MVKRKQDFILLAPMKILLTGCASIHTPDHGMKQNLVGVSYIH